MAKEGLHNDLERGNEHANSFYEQAGEDGTLVSMEQVKNNCLPLVWEGFMKLHCFWGNQT